MFSTPVFAFACDVFAAVVARTMMEKKHRHRLLHWCATVIFADLHLPRSRTLRRQHHSPGHCFPHHRSPHSPHPHHSHPRPTFQVYESANVEWVLRNKFEKELEDADSVMASQVT